MRVILIFLYLYTYLYMDNLFVVRRYIRVFNLVFRKELNIWLGFIKEC